MLKKQWLIGKRQGGIIKKELFRCYYYFICRPSLANALPRCPLIHEGMNGCIETSNTGHKSKNKERWDHYNIPVVILLFGTVRKWINIFFFSVSFGLINAKLCLWTVFNLALCWINLATSFFFLVSVSLSALPPFPTALWGVAYRTRSNSANDFRSAPSSIVPSFAFFSSGAKL